MPDTIHWVKIADFIEEIPFAITNIAEVAAETKKICMARYNGFYFAFAQKCPHAGGPFINGFIDALGNVVCPLHRYKFCLKNGRNVSGEGYYLKRWTVEIRENGVFVGFAKNSFEHF